MVTSAFRSLAATLLVVVGCGGATPDGGAPPTGDVPSSAGDRGAAESGTYEGCSEGQSCTGTTRCATSSFTRVGGTGSLCTASCTDSAQCPPNGAHPGFPPTCVVSAATGMGQCYGTCHSTTDCGERAVCAQAQGNGNQVCVPTGTGTITPAAVAYAACSPVGLACGSATTCAPSALSREGAAPGNLCTLACAGGNAAVCPGYVAGAALQSVECVSPAASPDAAQCVRLCNPANGNRDCAPFSTTCASIALTGRTISVCLP